MNYDLLTYEELCEQEAKMYGKHSKNVVKFNEARADMEESSRELARIKWAKDELGRKDSPGVFVPKLI